MNNARWLAAGLIATVLLIFAAVCLWGHASREEAVPEALKPVPQYGE